MTAITDILIPLVTLIIMLTVGLELTVADFSRTVQMPGGLVTGTASQIIILPVIALLLIGTVVTDWHLAFGLALVATAPGGALSNFYVAYAGANTAFSVSLTGISTLLSVVLMPFILSVLLAFASSTLASTTSVTLPFVIDPIAIGRILLLMLLFPVLVGMAVRHFFEHFVQYWRKAIRRIAVGSLVLLVVIVLLDQWQAMIEYGFLLVGVALLFSVLAMSAGWLIGQFASFEQGDSFALMMEFSIRNLAIVILVGTTVSRSLDYVAFGAVFFVVQSIIVWPVILLYRRRYKTAS
ncbi:MAG: hypothetical protein DHS20C01_08820 [marine bacterium B5-7]|nr:MAG: hypothetical protein DHS20C01_08820 [marine bacterium B5-7]